MEGVNNIIKIINSKTKNECDRIIAEAEEFKKQRLEKARNRARKSLRRLQEELSAKLMQKLPSTTLVPSARLTALSSTQLTVQALTLRARTSPTPVVAG